jgi:hypothetical protein
MFGREEILFLIIPFLLFLFLSEEDKFLNMIVTEKLLILRIEILFRF